MPLIIPRRRLSHFPLETEDAHEVSRASFLLRLETRAFSVVVVVSPRTCLLHPSMSSVDAGVKENELTFKELPRELVWSKLMEVVLSRPTRSNIRRLVIKAIENERISGPVKVRSCSRLSGRLVGVEVLKFRVREFTAEAQAGLA